jgi:hypothetical protein
MSDQVNVNGNLFSWGSIRVKCGGEEFTGFSKIAYADKRPRTKGYGMGRHQAPRGRSRGKYEVDPVTITAHRDSAEAFRDFLASKATDGKSFGNVSFEVVVQYVDEGETPVTDTLEACVWSGNTVSNEEGPDPLTVDIELDCMRINWNGKTLYDGTAA